MFKPIFTISLDMELAWGYILYLENKVLALIRSDPQKVRGMVDLLLRLFKEYDIRATWAVVGHLFLSSDEEEKVIQREMPQFPRLDRLGFLQ